MRCLRGVSGDSSFGSLRGSFTSLVSQRSPTKMVDANRARLGEEPRGSRSEFRGCRRRMGLSHAIPLRRSLLCVRPEIETFSGSRPILRKNRSLFRSTMDRMRSCRWEASPRFAHERGQLCGSERVHYKEQCTLKRAQAHVRWSREESSEHEWSRQ